MDLLFEAQGIHRRWHTPNEIQLSTLLSIKTGGCPEDCGYCSLSAFANSGLKASKLLEVQRVIETSITTGGLGAAWKALGRGQQTFQQLDGLQPVSLAIPLA